MRRDGFHDIEAIERAKERMGLRWTESIGGPGSPVEVTVRSSGLGWEARSSEPMICCRGRTPSDAMGFYRFCLAEHGAGA